MFRKVISVFAGIAAALAIIILLVWGTKLIYPPLSSADFDSANALAKINEPMPKRALVCILMGYAVGSFIGALLATLISGKDMSQPAMIVGVFCMVFAIVNIFQNPCPLWFMIANVIVCIAFSFIGYFAVMKKSTTSYS